MPPPNGVLRADIHYVLGGSLAAQNVLHFSSPNIPLTQDDTDDLATLLNSWVSAELMPPLSVDTLCTKVVVTGYEGGGLAFQTTSDVGVSGSRAAESPEPPQVAVVITWRTALPTKSGRGRTYIPGPSSTDIGGAGQVFDPLHSGIESAADGLTDGITMGVYELCVFSREDAVMRPVTGFTVQPQVKTQTRRLR